jgi:MFS family permease
VKNNAYTVESNQPTAVRLGLRENWRQFALLVLVNAFVGAMIGLERTLLPLIAEADFGLASRTLVLSFLISFGVVKALANLFAGGLGDRWGRKRILVAGWLVGLPVPLLIMYAPSWNWVILANVLLGINQGLCWSTTVIMKIDLVGPKQRGLAMGLNEFAGYLAVSLAALGTGYLAAAYGLRPIPFYPGLVIAVLGLLFSIVLVRETQPFTHLESRQTAEPESEKPSFAQIFWLASWQNKTLFSTSQAGLVNNLNDGMVWGLLPLFLAGMGLPVVQIGMLAAVYPGVWGISQLFTGGLSDRLGRKWLIVAGMWLQAGAIGLLVIGRSFNGWLGGAVLLGLGTAMVYPTLLAAVSDVAHPSWRGSAVGVYRLWRDSGYAIGALASGLLADAWGLHVAIAAIAGLTLFSGIIAAIFMSETLPDSRLAIETAHTDQAAETLAADHIRMP